MTEKYNVSHFEYGIMRDENEWSSERERVGKSAPDNKNHGPASHIVNTLLILVLLILQHFIQF